MELDLTNLGEKEERDNEAKRNKEAGFTLVELILVIALGAMIILAAMQLYTRARDSAVQDTYVQSLQSILAGVSEYRMYKGAIPAGTDWSAATGLSELCRQQPPEPVWV